MADDNLNNWIIIYRGYTADERACERVRLQKWLANPYNSQGSGAKNYSRDRIAITSQLAALQRVYNETSGQPCIGIMDASGGVSNLSALNAGINGFPNSWD